jgi:CHAT domain-containing protein
MRLAAIARELEGLDADLEARFPDIAALLSLSPVTLDRSQGLLHAGEALLATLSGPRRTHVFVVTRRGVFHHNAAIGAGRLGDLVAGLRRNLDPRQSGRNPKPFPLGLSTELYRLLVAPARVALDGVTHVLYVPDGALRNLPLSVLAVNLAAASGASAALKSAENREYRRYREVVWFIDKYAYSRIPSLGILAQRRASPPAARAPMPFVGIGGPDPAAASVPPISLGLSNMARRLGAGQDTLYLGPRARESEVKALDLDRYRLVALATPGNTAGGAVGLGEPSLVLSPPAAPGDDDDGRLTSGEIAGLVLNAELVVLGAGAPGGDAGALWLEGLAQAFRHAGARSLMVAHWPVEARAARAFTTGMIARGADDGSRGEARLLQGAALEVIGGDNRPTRFTHPRYWGAFEIMGDGGRRD